MKKQQNLHASVKASDREKEQCADNLVTAVIRGLDMFIAQANSDGVGTVARILTSAKEDLVYWAATMNFQETAQEKFINRLLYQNAMFAASDFIATFATVRDKKKLFKMLASAKFESSPYAQVAALRELTN